jgi:hypothetical protein
MALRRPPRDWSRRVVDETGRPVNHDYFHELSPAFTTAQDAGATTELLPVTQHSSSMAVRPGPRPLPKWYLDWEERASSLGAFWKQVDKRFAQLSEYVSGKSQFDDGQVRKWSEHIRTQLPEAGRIPDWRIPVGR